MLQIGGKNAFRQGIAQTVHETWQGVDARTGQSRLSNTTGMVMGNKALRIARSIAGGSQNALKGGENLLPVFDALGNVVAYERSMDPAKLVGLQRDTHLGRMLGVWTGRIAEESMAEEFNRDLLKVIKKTYDDQAKDPKNKFVNVADKKNADPLVRDAWNTLGWKIKADAAAIFGPDFLPVRADLVNDTIGYRAPGIADLWTGVSRWSPATQTKVKEMLIAVGGKSFYAEAQHFRAASLNHGNGNRCRIVTFAIASEAANRLRNSYPRTLRAGPTQSSTHSFSEIVMPYS